MATPTLDVANVSKSAGEAVELAKTLPRPTNAFTYQGSLGLYENFKLLLGIVLVPVRVILATLLIGLAAAFAQMSLWVGKPYGQPRGTLQKMFMVPVAYLMRAVLFVWGFYWIPRKGKKPKASEARMLVVASHSTMVDSLWIGYFFGMPAGISKMENKNLPLLGTVSLVSLSELSPCLVLYKHINQPSQPRHSTNRLTFCFVLFLFILVCIQYVDLQSPGCYLRGP
jgi:hypothetical protein